MRKLNKKANYLIANNLNEILNQIGVVEERILYLIVKELKKKVLNSENTEYDHLGEMVEMGDKVYDLEIEGGKLRKALKGFVSNDIKEMLSKFPLAVGREWENGDKAILMLFNTIKYIDLEDVFKVILTDNFYNYIIFDEMGNNFTRIYHDEFFTLNSKLSQKMYRLCSRWFELGVLNQKIDTLVDYFGFKNLKMSGIDRELKRVINKIAENTQFQVSYQKIKKEGKVTNMIWSFKINR